MASRCFVACEPSRPAGSHHHHRQRNHRHGDHAIKLGAYDYISKPYRMAEIDVMVRRAWEKRELGKANVMLRSRVAPLPVSLTSRNPVMRDIIAAHSGHRALHEAVDNPGRARIGKESSCAPHPFSVRRRSGRDRGSDSGRRSTRRAGGIAGKTGCFGRRFRSDRRAAGGRPRHHSDRRRRTR